MTSYQSDGGTPQPAASVEELLQNVGGTEDRCYRPLDEDEVFLAEIIVNIFLIQDSNSHPVFRLDTGAGPHQVGLETIGECGDTVVVVVVVVVVGKIVVTLHLCQAAESTPSLAATSTTLAVQTQVNLAKISMLIKFFVGCLIYLQLALIIILRIFIEILHCELKI